jgi:hypothetical protein
MNLRAVVAALYVVTFFVTLLNMWTLPPETFSEVAPILFTSLIMALAGMLIAFWVYQDGETLKVVHAVIAKLEQRGAKKEK